MPWEIGIRSAIRQNPSDPAPAAASLAQPRYRPCRFLTSQPGIWKARTRLLSKQESPALRDCRHSYVSKLILSFHNAFLYPIVSILVPKTWKGLACWRSARLPRIYPRAHGCCARSKEASWTLPPHHRSVPTATTESAPY